MDVMSQLFKKKKQPDQVVALLKQSLQSLPGEDERESQKLQEDIAKRAAQIKAFVYGDPDEKPKEKEGGLMRQNSTGGSSNSLASMHSASAAAAAGSKGEGSGDKDKDDCVNGLCRALCEEEVFPLLLTHMKAVGFEVRKAMAAVFNSFVRQDVLGFASPGGYLSTHTGLLYQLFDGYTSPDVALVCGSMARECIKIPHLHEALLVGPDGGLSQPLRSLFEEHVHNPNFEVAADAFETLQCMLTSNKSLVFRCLNPSGGDACQARYGDFFHLYSGLLTSDNYVLKRQSLRLLSEFLLDRENFRIMMKFISDRSNLKVIMGLLRHKQPAVQFEAFHVFKVFVANPDKPADIAEILSANKSKLIFFLQSFQNDKEDEQFAEEKAMLVDTLAQLPEVTVPYVATPTGTDPAAYGRGLSSSSLSAEAAAAGAAGVPQGGMDLGQRGMAVGQAGVAGLAAGVQGMQLGQGQGLGSEAGAYSHQ